MLSRLVKFSVWGQLARPLSTLLSPGPTPVLNEDLPVVAVIGRPNVGKSALFNRLISRKDALVFNTPEDHVTRDYKCGIGAVGDLRFSVVDTSGFEPVMTLSTIQARATMLTTQLMKKVDVALFLLDARQGLSPVDEAVAQWIRKYSFDFRVILVANKCEAVMGEVATQITSTVIDGNNLGFGSPIAVSAETGEGLVELYEELQPLIDELTDEKVSQKTETSVIPDPEKTESDAENNAEMEDSGSIGVMDGMDGTSESTEEKVVEENVEDLKGPIKVAIIGLPNVGKSTLLNHLVGRERSLTGPEPGLTRDAVADAFRFNEWDMELVDTAGWVKRTRYGRYDTKGGKVTFVSQCRAKSALEKAHVVVLMIDAIESLEQGKLMFHRELALASEVLAEGRALVLIINKIDAVSAVEGQYIKDTFPKKAADILYDMDGLPCFAISAKTGAGIKELLPTIVKLYRKWNKRISTPILNRWLRDWDLQTSITGGEGAALHRARFIVQTKIRPPTFTLQISRQQEFAQTKIRAIVRLLRKDFDFEGVPVRFKVTRKARGMPKFAGKGEGRKVKNKVREAGRKLVEEGDKKVGVGKGNIPEPGFWRGVETGEKLNMGEDAS